MTDPTVQKTRDNQVVESWLLFYEDRLLEYAANHRMAKQMKPWLLFVQAYEDSLAESAPNLLVVLRLRRQYRNHRGRRGWTSPVQARFPHELAALTGRAPEDHWKEGRNTFHGYWREIVDLAAREAIREGLL